MEEDRVEPSRYRRGHFDAELTLDSPSPGKYGITLGLDAFPVTCNGAMIDVRLLFVPCDNYSTLILGDRQKIAGEGTCGVTAMTWSLVANW